jgi:hypothetical protein
LPIPEMISTAARFLRARHQLQMKALLGKPDRARLYAMARGCSR